MLFPFLYLVIWFWNYKGFIAVYFEALKISGFLRRISNFLARVRPKYYLNFKVYNSFIYDLSLPWRIFSPYLKSVFSKFLWREFLSQFFYFLKNIFFYFPTSKSLFTFQIFSAFLFSFGRSLNWKCTHKVCCSSAHRLCCYSQSFHSVSYIFLPSIDFLQIKN